MFSSILLVLVPIPLVYGFMYTAGMNNDTAGMCSYISKITSFSLFSRAQGIALAVDSLTHADARNDTLVGIRDGKQNLLVPPSILCTMLNA